MKPNVQSILELNIGFSNRVRCLIFQESYTIPLAPHKNISPVPNVKKLDMETLAQRVDFRVIGEI